MAGTATVLLVRHGLTEVTGTSLAGWTPGVHLDTRGRAQADTVARRLAALPLAAVVSSPLERCVETARAIAAANTATPDTQDLIHTDVRVGECDYGEWTGRALKDLAREELWAIVQAHPSAARFPGGESLAGMAQRAVAAVRDHNERLLAEHDNPVYVVCSHGDVIKAIAADAMGLHLDQFQRIVVDPCSVTAIRYTATRPFLLRLNDLGDDTAGLLPPAQPDTETDAVVGGGGGAGSRESP